MIDSMFQAGTDAALDDQVRRAGAFKPEEPGFSLLRVPKRLGQGISSGSTKSAAFGAEIAGAFGDVAGAGGFNQGGMFSLPTDAERKQQEDARNKLLERGPQFSNEAGDFLREAAKNVLPDPLQTHAAEQTIAALASGFTQAVGYTVAAGPVAGAALFAGDTGMAESDSLRKQGVDLATRTKAGAVVGAVSGASLLVPVAVPGSIAKTAAAVVVGGPAATVGQKAIEKAIIANAGYEKIADRIDPLDPTELALSTLVPAAFGAHAVRSRAVAPVVVPTLHDVILSNESGGRRYGKDGKLLTSPKGAQGEMQVMPGTARDPGFGVKPAKDGSPEELARVGRDYVDMLQQRYGGDEAKAMAAYNAGPGALDAALKKGGNWLEHLPAETQAYVAKGMRKLQGGRATAAARTAVAADPEAVAAARVGQVAETVDSYRLTPDSDMAGLTAHQDAMESAHDMIARGDRVDIGDLIRSEPSANEAFVPWSEQVDGAIAEVRTARQPEPAVPVVEAAKPGSAPDGIAPVERVDGTLNARATGKDVPNPFASLIDELTPQLTGKQPGQLVNELKTAGKLSPLANNTIIGLAETGGDPARITSLVQHADALAREAPGRPPADVMADAVERMRAGAPAPSAKAETQSPVTKLASSIEQANPDMPARLTADGERVSAATELDAVRKEAAEGTDTTLGANDAPLLQVAMECFLNSGGI